MGILNFLKPKKRQENKADLSSFGDLGTLPPTSQTETESAPQQNEAELYSELPNLPEAPESLGLPEIELPSPLKENLDDSAFNEMKDNFESAPEKAPTVQEPPKAVEPLLPDWPKMGHEEINMPEVPDIFSGIEKSETPNVPERVPDIKPYAPAADAREASVGKLVSHNNSFFLKAEDFRMIKNDLNELTGMQKKHHKLTEIKKGENEQYERMNALIEDMQRKLMHLDKTLFE